MKKILELLQDKINEEFVPLKTDDKIFDFLKDFFNDYAILNIETLLEADRARLLTVVVISENIDIDVQMVYEFFQENIEYLEGICDCDPLLEIVDFLSQFDLEKIDDSIFEREDVKANFDEEFIEIAKYLAYNKLGFRAYETNLYINEMNKKIKECGNNLAAVNSMILGKVNTSLKEAKKFGYEYIKKNSNIKIYLKYLYEARQYYKAKIALEDSFKKSYNKLRNSYQNLYNIINNAYVKNEAIKYTDNFFGSINDNDFKMMILKEIYKYNKEIYDKMSQKYNKLIANSILNFKELLLKYGIVYNDYQLNKITSKDISDVEEILQALRVKGFDSADILSEIILLTDLDTVKRYVSLMETGLISKELLINNIELFNNNSILYTNFSKNIEYINEKGINPYLFQSSQHVLLLDFNVFTYNINILETYNLLNNIKGEDNYNFFDNNNLDLAIDILLELGLEEYLEEDLALLNYSNRFNRLRLLKSLNITISSKEELIKYLTDNNFFVPDSKLDEYIYNSVDYFINYDNLDYNELSYYTTSRTYKMGNLIFSKNRVLRNLSLMENNLSEKQRLVHAFLDGAFLTDNELEEFKELVVSDKRKVLK